MSENKIIVSSKSLLELIESINDEVFDGREHEDIGIRFERVSKDSSKMTIEGTTNWLDVTVWKTHPSHFRLTKDAKIRLTQFLKLISDQPITLGFSEGSSWIWIKEAAI